MSAQAKELIEENASLKALLREYEGALAEAIENLEAWKRERGTDPKTERALKRGRRVLNDLPDPHAPPAFVDFLIWSHEHQAWWRHASRGYTCDVMEAGLYRRAEAEDICRSFGADRDESALPALPVLEAFRAQGGWSCFAGAEHLIGLVDRLRERSS